MRVVRDDRHAPLRRPWPTLMSVVDDERMCVAALRIQGRRRKVRVARSDVGMGVRDDLGIRSGPEARRHDGCDARKRGHYQKRGVEPCRRAQPSREWIGAKPARV